VTQQTEQVGSSFKPYVLSAAVQQGMNVQSSVMDTSPYACIAPPSRGSTVFSQPVTPAVYHQASSSSTFAGCPSSSYFPEENDSGELIGKTAGVGNGTNGTVAGAQYYSDTVQDALAQSSNVAFTDLIHKTGTTAPENIAEAVGTSPTAFTSRGDPNFGNTVGIALGEAPMTVQDQASLVAMLDDNGTFHTAHLIQYWEDTTAGTKNTPTVTSNQVLTPAQASQVQYAMEMTTVNGTAKGLVQMSQDGRQVIGKTGTTTSNHSGFFIGGIPQFAMAVGMFTSSISDKSQNLGLLDSSNAANIYPTMIWNAFANAAYANTTPESFQQPQFSGAKWDMLGPVPKAKPKPKPKPTPSQTPGKGKKGILPFPTTGPSSSPNPTPSTCSGLFGCPSPSSSPSAPTSSPSPPIKRHPGG
jgi:membrane peptidoglycan carboxypeptidase